MSAKIYSLESYKNKKFLNGMTKIEFANITFNIIFSVVSWFLFIVLFLYLSLIIPHIQLMALIMGILMIIFISKHLFKIIKIYKNRQIKYNLEYLLKHQLYVTVLCGILNIALVINSFIHFTLILLFFVPLTLLMFWNTSENHKISKKYLKL